MVLDVLVKVYEGNVPVRVCEGIVTEVSEETPARSCVGEEPARPLGVAHLTDRRKEREGKIREKEAKFPFFILFEQNFDSSLTKLNS